MITGTHLIIYSKDEEADKAFFRDILKFPNVDVVHGWLIFGLPPSELAIHPSAENDRHEIYLMCDDIKTFSRQLSKQKIKCSEIQNKGWGQLVQLTLPGGGKLGVYQPRHARPAPMKVKTTTGKTVSKETVTKRAGTAKKKNKKK
ncbi:MAG: extradiol dioxygenase [Chitinophagaceae bacterium]